MWNPKKKKKIQMNLFTKQKQTHRPDLEKEFMVIRLGGGTGQGEG